MEKIKIIIATNNENKVKEIESFLANDQLEYFTLKQIGFNKDIVENGTTYIENAMIKAREIQEFFNGYWVIADDSGLEVPYLNNEPGLFSARYAGDHNDKKNIDKLLNKLHDTKDSDRIGRFVCAIACIIDDNTSFITEGEVWGTILREPRGEGGFGYDPIMYYPSMNKTFAEMTFSEKNSISHRANALGKLKVKIDDFLEAKK